MDCFGVYCLSLARGRWLCTRLEQYCSERFIQPRQQLCQSLKSCSLYPVPFPASRSHRDTLQAWESVPAQSPSASQFMITAAFKAGPWSLFLNFAFIVSFLFASISSLSASGLALITVPWFLFPSWPFPSVFLTPFPSQAPGLSDPHHCCP